MKVNFYTYQTNNINKNRNNENETKPSFGAASDITLKYVMDNNSQYLPKRVLSEIRKFCASGNPNMPKLYEFHEQIYKPLFEATTLDVVKRNYPEFKDIIDITKIANSRSKAIIAIKEKMPLENFTLEYLKDLYRPMRQEDIVKKYGFTNRSLSCWVNDKLNIEKLSSPYLRLVFMSNEIENQRVAEMSRRAIYANAEAQKYRLERAAEAHRTPEYRAKKRQEMIDFYNRNPEARESVRKISQATWDECAEIKKAMSDFVIEQDEFTRTILSKNEKGLN